MKIKIFALLILMVPIASLAAAESCKPILNTQYEDSFLTEDKENLVENIVNSELNPKELAYVIQLIKRNDTEAYSGGYDSGDAGFYLTIVDEADCKVLWDGFLAYY